MDAELQADKGKKTQAEVDSMIQLASEVRLRILTKQLQPGRFTIELRSNSQEITVYGYRLLRNSQYLVREDK
jgi:hypothetical protein